MIYQIGKYSNILDFTKSDNGRKFCGINGCKYFGDIIQFVLIPLRIPGNFAVGQVFVVIFMFVVNRVEQVFHIVKSQTECLCFFRTR